MSSQRIRVYSLLLIVLAGSIYLFMWLNKGIHRTYGQAREWSEHIYEPLTKQSELTVAAGASDELAAQEWLLDDRKPFTMLLMGVDARNGDKGRADTLIFAAVNPIKRSTLVFSIPRDTRVVIAGRDGADKINHAYAYGGVSGTVATVEQLLDVPVHYYFKVDMEGFVEIVDALGGVRVDNHQSFRYEGHRFDEGELALSGEETLAYVRMRYEDPRGDLGRGDRQRAVLAALKDQMFRVNNLLKLTEWFEVISRHMKTNITWEDWKSLLLDYRDAADQVQVEALAGRGAYLSDIYYYILTDDEISRIKSRVSEQLNMDEDTNSNILSKNH